LQRSLCVYAPEVRLPRESPMPLTFLQVLIQGAALDVRLLKRVVQRSSVVNALRSVVLSIPPNSFWMVPVVLSAIRMVFLSVIRRWRTTRIARRVLIRAAAVAVLMMRRLTFSLARNVPIQRMRWLSRPWK